MRELKLKSLPVNDEQFPEIKVLDYKEQFLITLKKPIKGMTTDDMEIAIRTISKIKLSTLSSLLLEEDEYKYLLLLVNNNVWGIAIPELLEMINDVRNAKQIEVASPARVK